jgi:hypothetical protein
VLNQDADRALLRAGAFEENAAHAEQTFTNS